MPIEWQEGRMVGATGHGMRLTFEPMPQEGVEALRMLRNGGYVGVLWFAPYSINAELQVHGQRKVLDGFDDAEDLVAQVLELVAALEPLH